MQAKFRILIDKVNALSLRERALVLLACLVVMFQAWDSWIWTPLSQQQDRFLSEESRINEQMLQMQVELKILTAKANLDPDQETKKQISSLQGQLEAVNDQIVQASSSLVSPEEMARLLEQLLTSEKSLQLLDLRTLDAVALIPESEKQAAKRNYQIYRHEFTIEFEGNYLATLRYLEALEKLPWTFFWEGIEYQVDEYPKSRIRLSLYTLSLSEGWIGV